MKAIFWSEQFLSLLCIIIISGCGENKLPKYSDLTGLRILGIIANPPEIDAGGITSLTPILSDITETTALSYEATACLDPGVGYGALPTCEGQSSTVAIQSGTMNSGDMALARNFTGMGVSFTVTAPPASVIFAQRSAPDQFNGIGYLVVYKITNSAGQSVQSFKRIIVSTRGGSEKNNNPVLSDILVNGASFSTVLSLGQKLSIAPSFGSTAETFIVKASDGSPQSKEEELTTSWFLTDGLLKSYRTLGPLANEWDTPISLPLGRDVFLLALTRDGRGGLSVNRKCFGTCP